jgi:hypothetical protein
MGVRGLAEGIILQSMADLWDEREKEASIAFFKGKDFTACAKTAGMSLNDQIGLLNMVKEVIDQNQQKKEPLHLPKRSQKKVFRELTAS